MVATKGKGWVLAPALVDLIDEVDRRWPARSTKSDGSIGDASHAARPSEHNPDRDPDGMPRGMVSAVDITKESAGMMTELRKAVCADPRTWYVIHDRKIYSRTNGFKAKAYDGPNPHTAHMHVSLLQTEDAAKAGPWGVSAPGKAPAAPDKPERATLASGVRYGSSHPQTAVLQRALIKAGYGPIPDGITDYYGKQTRAAVARFHQAHPHFRDHNPGQIGPKGFQHLLAEAAL